MNVKTSSPPCPRNNWTPPVRKLHRAVCKDFASIGSDTALFNNCSYETADGAALFYQFDAGS